MALTNYFIYGDEPYLIEEKIKEIIDALKAQSDDFYVELLPDEISVQELLLTLNTIPLGFFKRVVLLKNPKFISEKLAKNEEASLLEYLGAPNLDTIFIFSLSAVEKVSALIKKIAEKCESFYLTKPSKEGLKALFLLEAKKRGKKIEANAISYLVQKAQFLPLFLVIGELEKASLYSNEETLSKEIIEKVAIPMVNETIFTLLDGVFEKNLQKAYNAWQDLAFMGEPIIKVVYQLTDGFKRLLLVAGLLEEGKSASDIEKFLNKHPFVIKKSIGQLKTLKPSALAEGIHYLLMKDIHLKSAAIRDEKGLMEDILVNLISKLRE